MVITRGCSATVFVRVRVDTANSHRHGGGHLLLSLGDSSNLSVSSFNRIGCTFSSRFFFFVLCKKGRFLLF